LKQKDVNFPGSGGLGFAVGHALLIEALLLITKVSDGSGAEDGLEH
jgi:hypothetical protein